MKICHTKEGVKLISIAAHHKSICVWRNGKREYELATNADTGKPHTGFRTGAIFERQGDAIQWAIYNFGSTREIWVERRKHYEKLN